MTDLKEKEVLTAEAEAPAKKAPAKKKTVAAEVTVASEETVKKPAAKKKTTAQDASTEAPVKKPAAKKAAAETKTEAPVTETKKAEVAEKTAEVKAPAKNAKKKAPKTKAPLYINGRFVAEKQFAAKPAKGAKPYALGGKQIKVTLIKSTAGCLEDQQRTVAALGLTKIRTSKVHLDNEAIRGMIFKVKHLVRVEDVK